MNAITAPDLSFGPKAAHGLPTQQIDMAALIAAQEALHE